MRAVRARLGSMCGIRGQDKGRQAKTPQARKRTAVDLPGLHLGF